MCDFKIAERISQVVQIDKSCALVIRLNGPAPYFVTLWAVIY